MRFSYKDNGITANEKCKLCGDKAKDIRKQYDDYAIIDGSFSEKLEGWICFPCRESEESRPQGTVLIFDPSERTVTRYVVMAHEDESGTTNIEDPSELENVNVETDDFDETSPIQFVYKHTDAWRGFYEPIGENWKVLHSDCILSGSEDERQLKEFDMDIKKMLWELGYEFAVAFGTTSNLFSCGYDVLVKTNQENDILKQITLYSKLMQLTQKYRDPERFRMTALTGKSEGFDNNDRLLSEAAKRLEKGEEFETVKNDILEKAHERSD
jgi:hypothetical protein